jgi:hypothetical protein
MFLTVRMAQIEKKINNQFELNYEDKFIYDVVCFMFLNEITY